MNALRVGLFTECYHPIRNGVVASVDALAAALRSRGHEALFVTPEMPAYRDVRSDLVRVPSLPLPTRTAYRLTVPYLPRLGTLSVVHTHSPFVTGWLGSRAAHRARVPLVFTYHTQLEQYAHYVPFDSNATRSAASQLTRTYANAADAVIVPTLTMERRLRELGVRSQIEVIPSGIDVAFFASGRRDDALRARLGVARDQKMVLSVGRLGREKNVELAIEAFARSNDASARFVIVGDGPHREALERYAQRCGVADRTVFAREFGRAQLPAVYACADALLFTSSSETQGLVLVEALAAGVPIVALDTPQTRDVLEASGYLADSDPSAIAAALDRAFVTRSLEAKRRTVAARKYDAGVLGDRIIALYRSLIGPETARVVS